MQAKNVRYRLLLLCLALVSNAERMVKLEDLAEDLQNTQGQATAHIEASGVAGGLVDGLVSAAVQRQQQAAALVADHALSDVLLHVHGQEPAPAPAPAAAAGASSNAATTPTTTVATTTAPSTAAPSASSTAPSTAASNTAPPAAGASTAPAPAAPGTAAPATTTASSKLEKQGKRSVMSAFGKLAEAANDPRKFLMEQPGISTFIEGLRAAVNQQPGGEAGKCLKEGKFATYGCADICTCRGLLDICYLPTNGIEIAKQHSTAEGQREALAMLVGRCQRSNWLLAGVCAAAAAVLLILACALRCMLLRKKEVDEDDD